MYLQRSPCNNLKQATSYHNEDLIKLHWYNIDINNRPSLRHEMGEYTKNNSIAFSQRIQRDNVNQNRSSIVGNYLALRHFRELRREPTFNGRDRPGWKTSAQTKMVGDITERGKLGRLLFSCAFVRCFNSVKLCRQEIQTVVMIIVAREYWRRPAMPTNLRDFETLYLNIISRYSTKVGYGNVICPSSASTLSWMRNPLKYEGEGRGVVLHRIVIFTWWKTYRFEPNTIIQIHPTKVYNAAR